MNFSFTRICVFGVVSLAALALIAIYDVPVEKIIDPRTGVAKAGALTIDEPIPLFPSVEDVFRLSRNRGDAQAALLLLTGLRSRMRSPQAIEEIVEALRGELLSPATLAADYEKTGRASRDLDRRRSALEWLAAPVDSHTDVAENIEKLEDLEVDQSVASAVESFFLPGVPAPSAQVVFERSSTRGDTPDRAVAAAMRLADARIDRMTPERCRRLAALFTRPNRVRARTRWLLRAFRASPASIKTALVLARTYLDAGRQREALVTLATTVRAGGESLELAELWAQLAAWNSEPTEEAAALEMLLEYEDRTKARERLVTLYEFLGRSRDAVPHVIHLARQKGTPEALGDAATVALTAGETKQAIAILDEASQIAADPLPFRDRIVEIYLRDMQIDPALAELRDLAKNHPGHGYRTRLEDLLRRTGQEKELAERLFARIREGPDPDREEEAIELYGMFGEPEKVREILLLQLERTKDPVAFFEKLGVWTLLDLPDLMDRAMAFARSDELRPESVGAVLAALDDQPESAGYLAVARVVVARFPDLPECVAFLKDHAPAGSEGTAAGDGEETAASREEELRRMMEEAKRPDLTPDERRDLAERLFAADRMDVALVLYGTLLKEVPDDRLALLRTGQIRAWGNDPYGAIPFFERCLELYGPGDGELPFLLGEAYYAIDRQADGRAQLETALPLLRSTGELTPVRESMVAKVLARFGKGEEARAIFARLMTDDDHSPDLLLDYADTLLALNDVEAARHITAKAAELAPDDPRVLRLTGQIDLLAGDLEKALAVYNRGRNDFGPDAGFSSGAAEALLGLGRLAPAAKALDEALALQPENRNFAWSRRRLADVLSSPVAEFETRTLTSGDDRIFSITAEGSELLDADRTRLSAVFEEGFYRGTATLAPDPARTWSTNLTALGLGLSRRLGPGLTAGGGLDFYPTLSGIRSIGGWAEARLETPEPHVTARLRLFAGEPLREPAAGLAMGGARHGLEAAASFEPRDAGYWLSGRLAGSSLTLDPPGLGAMSSGQVAAELVFGVWISGTGPEIQARVSPRSSLPVQEGTTVAGEPPSERGPRLVAWVGWSGMRLTGGRELTGVLPLLDRYDYVTATVRGQEPLGDGVIAMGEFYAGTDLADPGLIGGATIGFAWRPRQDFEVRLEGSHGFAVGRSDGGQGASSVTLAFTLDF